MVAVRPGWRFLAFRAKLMDSLRILILKKNTALLKVGIVWFTFKRSHAMGTGANDGSPRSCSGDCICDSARYLSVVPRAAFTRKPQEERTVQARKDAVA